MNNMDEKTENGFWSTIGFVVIASLAVPIGLFVLFLWSAVLGVVSGLLIVFVFAPIIIPIVWWIVGSAWLNGDMQQAHYQLSGWPFMIFDWMGLWVFPVGAIILFIWYRLARFFGDTR